MYRLKLGVAVKLLIILYFCGICECARQIQTFPGKSPEYAPTKENSEKVVVELAVVCDMDFSQRFQNNDEQIFKYVSAIFWDAHLRFQTLQSTRVAFRVNHIIALESKEEQWFIERNRLENGTLLANDVLPYFGSWLFSQNYFENFTSYDVAVLAVGTPFAGTILGIAYKGLACKKTYLFGKVLSALALSFEVRNNDIGHSLTHELAHIVGAPHDVEINFRDNDFNIEYGCTVSDISQQQFIMGIGLKSRKKVWKHIFSSCSDKEIKDNLQLSETSCLRKNEIHVAPLVDTSHMCNTYELSMEDQCRVLLNDSSARIIRDSESCYQAACEGKSKNENTTSLKFVPLEGTRCGLEQSGSRCFWGLCIPSGVVIVNAASRLGLGSGNPFVPNDAAILFDYQSKLQFIPVDFFRINFTKPNGTQLMLLYYNNVGNHIGQKCLYRDTTLKVSFRDCAGDSEQDLWKLEPVAGTNNNAFLIRHAASGECLVISENSTDLRFTNSCSTENEWNHWQFFTENDLLMNLSCAVYKNSTEFVVSNSEAIQSRIYHFYSSHPVWSILLVVLALILFVTLLVRCLCYRPYILTKSFAKMQITN